MRQGSKRATIYTLVLTGAILGGVMISPVGAHVRKGLPHLRQHLDNFFLTDAEGDAAYINVGEAVSNADKLDNLDSTAFLPVAGKAADADKLDNLNSTDFLRSTAKAADADKLDNLDSTAFLQSASTLNGVFSCPGASFDPENGGPTSTLADGLRRANGVATTVRCAVHLPNGATVTGVTFTVLDDSAPNAVTCSVKRTDIVTPVVAEDTLAGPASTAVDTAVATSLSPALVAGKTAIANASFGYSLACDLDGTGETGVYGAAVTYTSPASAG